MHVQYSLCEMVNELQEELGRVFAVEKDIMSAKKFQRDKRMKQIIQNCENLEDVLLAFLRHNSSPMPPPLSRSSYYTYASNVPPNPPRLILDYSDNVTCEGELKDAVRGQIGQRIIAFIASVQGFEKYYCKIFHKNIIEK